MFTGIVAGTGAICEMSGEEVVRIVIDFQSVTTDNLETGASVSIDGMAPPIGITRHVGKSSPFTSILRVRHHRRAVGSY